MQALAAAAIAALIGASILVSCRLLLLHRRTGAWPELLLGAMLLLSVGIGYPLRVAATRAGPAWAGAFLAASAVAIAVGFSLLFVFTWRVFRPHATWALALTVAGAATALGKALHGCLRVQGRGAFGVMDESTAEVLLQTVPIAVAYLWTAWESLRCYGMMRRRVRLGLADAVVSDRFLLWGLMGLGATAGVSFNTGAVALGVDTLNSAWALVVSSAMGVGQAVLLVLAFVPPRSYLDRVRARAVAWS